MRVCGGVGGESVICQFLGACQCKVLRCRVKKQFFKPLIKRLEFKYRPSLSFSDGLSLLGYIFKPTTWSSKLFQAFTLKDRLRRLSLGLRALAPARYTPILLQHLFKHSSTRSSNLSAAMPCCPASQPAIVSQPVTGNVIIL